MNLQKVATINNEHIYTILTTDQFYYNNKYRKH